ncbi:MAG: hypothetical protein DRN03_04415, partial [Thermoplasmata archaeon]
MNFTGDFVNLMEDKTTIIERIKKGEFIVLADDSMQYPMGSLGSVEYLDMILFTIAVLNMRAKRQRTFIFPPMSSTQNPQITEMSGYWYGTSKLIYEFSLELISSFS